MPESYLHLLVYAALLVLVGAGLLGLTVLLPRLLGAQKRPTPTKLEPYECGIPSPVEEGARGRFSVRFYLIAILFILFDVETVFLIPWAAQYRLLGAAAFIEVLVFIGVLALALVYVWRRGALEWE
ncbi:MAG: hypothetical protein KatS3mg102_2585 [Planctomycetota bacterium]|nr:MAG: hypothetical protein KatS3mg102_2585 [Planctomycetota bacterium]